MFKPSVLLVALLLSSTALWSGFVTGSMSVTTALIRFLIAVPVAALMVYAFNSIVRQYERRARVPAETEATELPGAGLEAR